MKTHLIALLFAGLSTLVPVLGLLKFLKTDATAMGWFVRG